MTAKRGRGRKARAESPCRATQPGAAVPHAPLVPLLEYQRLAVAHPARFTWNNWSRQTGKSFAFALRRILRGMQRNRNQILFSAGERQSRELMEKARQHLTAIRAAVDATVEDLPEGQFEGTKFGKLETRVAQREGRFDFRIIALPANPMTARGYTGDVLFDEFAMHRDDREVWGAVFPICLRGGGEIDICSTPKGRKNLFYRLAANDTFAHSRVTIDDAIAAGLTVDRDELRRAMGDDDLFAQEFLCEFLDEATAFLTHEMIVACEDATLDKLWNDAKRAACADEELFVGADIGRHRDLTVIWVWGRPRGADVMYTRGVIELLKTPFAAQRDELVAIARLPGMRRMCIDATGLGMQLAEEVAGAAGAHRIEGVTFTTASKAEMAGGLRVRVEDRRVRIPVDADIRNDWHSVERQVLPGGAIRYAADRGAGGTPGHADRFWAAALGAHAAGSAGWRPLEMTVGRPAAAAGAWF